MPGESHPTTPLSGQILESRAGRFFWKLTDYPKAALALSILAIAGASAFLPAIVLDTSSEAFIEADHPSVVYRKKVKQIFGLSDPIIVAVVNNGPTGVFNPHTLELIKWVTDQTAAASPRT